MKNKLIILTVFLSLGALNAQPVLDTILENQRQTEQYFANTLSNARQARREGDYVNAGRTLHSLSRNQNENAPGQPEVRPGTRIASEALAELNDMRRMGQWNDDMHSRIMYP